MLKIVLAIASFLVLPVGAIAAEKTGTAAGVPDSGTGQHRSCDLIAPKDLENALDLTITGIVRSDKSDFCILNVASDDIFNVNISINYVGNVDLATSGASIPGVNNTAPRNDVPGLGRSSMWKDTGIAVVTESGQQVDISLSGKSQKLSDTNRKQLVALLRKALPALDDFGRAEGLKRVQAKLATLKNDRTKSTCFMVGVKDIETAFGVQVMEVSPADTVPLCSFTTRGTNILSFSVSLLGETIADLWDIMKRNPVPNSDGSPVRTENISNMGKSAYWLLGKNNVGIMVWTKQGQTLSVSLDVRKDLTQDDKNKLLGIVRGVLEGKR